MEKIITRAQIKRMKRKALSLEKKNRSSSLKGVPPGHLRLNFNIPEDLVEKIKDIAYWERVALKDVVIESFRKLISSRNEKKIKPRPKEKKEVLEPL